MSANGNTPLLQLTEVEAVHGDFQALFTITLTVNRGEIVTLIGAHGAGKTTTLRVISGLLRAKKGAPSFDGQDIAKTPAHEIVARGISHVPEGSGVLPAAKARVLWPLRGPPPPWLVGRRLRQIPR